MKVSLNTVKQFTPVEIPVDELVQNINQQLGSVEEVIDLNERYKDAVIVKVLSAEKHANADKLSVCIVDDGGVVKDVERDKDGHVQVVCGAPNVHADMYAIWLPPKSTVPASFDDKEPFVLDVREIRGVLSNGMLAAADELGIGTDHSGIIELTDADVADGKKLKAGASFAETFDLDDTIIDIENKMFTHRPDLFGQLGVAREIRAILQPEPSATEHSEQFTDDVDWYWRECASDNGEGLDLTVNNDIPELVPRFMAVALKDVKVGPSPMWLQTTLVRWGSKPINNVVDLTNYIMLLTAQPTHAYDYDKLRGKSLSVRSGKKGEKLELLNGKTYSVSTNDIVIADAEGAIGLGGIMGGKNSEVSADTKNVVLEVATFDMYAVRKTAMRHGVFTDALTRFNKGQSYLQNHRVLNRLMQLMGSIAGAQQASDVADLTGDKSVKNQESIHDPLRIDASFVNERLGLQLNAIQIGNILRPAQFATYRPDDGKESEVMIHAPFWRTDIVDPEDIVEEVGRLYGFDKLPRELPLRQTTPAPKNAELVLKQSIRDRLATAGANEVLTYSFVHEKVLKNAGQNPEKAFKLSNALSPDLQYYRLSVLPSLLAHVHANIRAGHDEFMLFELGKGHHKDYLDDDKLPIEFNRFAGVYANKAESKSAPYYQVKSIIQSLLGDMGVKNVRHQPLSDFDFDEHDVLRQLAAPFAENRSAMLWVGEKFKGIVGEFKPAVIRDFKLPENSAGFELFLSLFEDGTDKRTYQPLSRYPSTWQDISLKVSAETAYADIFATAEKAASSTKDIDVELAPLSIYQPEKDSTSKTITLRVKLTHHDRTLKEADAAAVIDAIATAAAGQHSATVV